MFSRYSLRGTSCTYLKTITITKKNTNRPVQTISCTVRSQQNEKNTLRNQDTRNYLIRNKNLLSRYGISIVSNHRMHTSANVLQINIHKETIPVSETVPNRIVAETVTESSNKTISESSPDTISQSSSIVPETIPEPPSIPLEDIAETIVASGEPTFASLGLGGWSPIGIVQNCLEFFHIAMDIPWWAAIAIGTIIVRTLMFPLVIIAQRNAAKMNNYLPQIQVLQLKMTEARQTGNQLEAARYGQEMMAFMKEKQLNPLKNMIVPLAQMPLFISFFMGLREMANTPVGSMKEGGLYWFADLTLPDQYFALPVVTSITMWLTIELGTDSAKLSSQNMQTMKYVLRALPIIVFPFTVNFPGAILCYWVCTNFISLGQVGFLKIPKVREFFKIEKSITHSTDQLPIKPKGFVQGIKESWTNMKISNEMEGRRRYDEMQFQRAGKGPIVKTYKYDPTKQTEKT